jgi:hypothetical protein
MNKLVLVILGFRFALKTTLPQNPQRQIWSIISYAEILEKNSKMPPPT